MIATLEPIVRAEDLFSQLKPEDEHERRQFEINKTSIAEILKGFEKFPEVQTYFRRGDYIHLNVYEACVQNIPKEYSKKDIEIFARFLNNSLLPEYLDRRKMGFYLSALCNNCFEDNIELKLGHLPNMWYLGFRNRKNLIVHGNMIEFLSLMDSGNVEVTGEVKIVGFKMRNGRIQVQGNCLGVGGEMNGGEIVVNGNAGNVGAKMKKGNIKIYGDVDRYLCYGMKGGEIEISGSYLGDYKVGRGMKGGRVHIQGDREFELSKEISGGDIYRAGRPLVLDGRRVER